MAEPNEPNNTPTPPAPPVTPTGKVYSEDYVTSLRQESATYRTRAKAHESTIESIRKAFGIKDDEDIGDITERLSTVQQAAVSEANTRLINAELKSLEGFDHKLLSKLIDLKSVKVGDDGKITGLKEAAEAVAKEYPSVKQGTRDPVIPPNPAGDQNPPKVNGEMNAFIRGVR